MKISFSPLFVFFVSCVIAAPAVDEVSIGPVSRTTADGPTYTRNYARASSTPITPGTPAPAPTGFNITSLGVNGSGCPPGSAYYLLSTDHTAVTITFSQFGAEAGPGISISQNRKNCQATLGVHVPGGFSFGVATVDYRGYYQLDSKVSATQDATYYFQGQLEEATAHSDLLGPVAGDDYTYRDEFDITSTSYSPCGEDTVLNINTAIRVNNANNTKGSGYISTDSIDTSLLQTFSFQWQTC